MNLVIEIVGFGFIVPAMVSVAMVFVCQRFLPKSISTRYMLAVSLAMGFLAGYSFLPTWTKWIPTRHWHWLPYLTIVSVIVGGVSLARGVRLAERCLLYLILAIGSALVLVPHWSNIEPMRHYYVGFLSALFLVSA